MDFALAGTDQFVTFGNTFTSLTSTITGLSPGTAYQVLHLTPCSPCPESIVVWQFRARMLAGSTWTDFTPTTVSWPTLAELNPLIVTEVTSSGAQWISIQVNSSASGSDFVIGSQCFTREVADSAFSSSTSLIGTVNWHPAVGYAEVANSSDSMVIQTVDGSAAFVNSPNLLRRCTSYQFRCRVQNVAGWTPLVDSEVTKTLPFAPAQAASPQVDVVGADSAVRTDGFTVELDEPADTAITGGECSEYTFSVRVSRDQSMSTVVTHASGLLAGSFDVGSLNASTTYWVTVKLSNQVGDGAQSNPQKVNTETVEHCVVAYC